MFTSMVSSPIFDAFGGTLSADPVIRMMQLGLLAFACLDVFLLLFTLRDITLRTHSFAYQAFCVLLVALVPFFGFCLYLLLRPGRSIKERELEAMVRSLVVMLGGEVEVSEAEENDSEEEEHIPDTPQSPAHPTTPSL